MMFLKKLCRRLFCRHGMFEVNPGLYICRKHAQNALVIRSNNVVSIHFLHTTTSFTPSPPDNYAGDLVLYYSSIINKIANYEV